MNIRLRRNIYVMNADGTQRVQVTVNTTVNSAASWSPDGTKIAFARVIDGNDEIYVMNADCSNQLRLTNNEFEDNWPRWSPDGSKIVFDSHRGLGTGKAQSNIFVINADGTGETNLTPNSFVNSMPDQGSRHAIPLDCSNAAPSVASLWPADHKMKDVTIPGVTNSDGDNVTTTITSIYQDEPTKSGTGDKSPDGAGVGTSIAQIRAERLANGDGRTYHIGFTADDGNGRTCSGNVKVEVPLDQRPIRSVGDQGSLYDSTVS